MQEAFVEALRTWPSRGVPANPGAWITTTARNRALDRARRESSRGTREEAAVRMVPEQGDDGTEEVAPVPDDQLRLLFTCAHPALAPEAQVALTLRLVCGLSAAEVARALLATEGTITRRLSRAKVKIRTAGIPFRVPPASLLPERLPVVLACTSLVFTEGYAATSGDALVRVDLCAEGVRLASLLVELMPDEPEARGLLALLLLQDSRRATRLGPDGDLVLLEDQDRSRWDTGAIQRGLDELAGAMRRGAVGSYQLQAAIAAAHATAPSWEATDWPLIARLYADLARVAPSPVVELNRAVAVAFAHGPAAGLALLDALVGDARLARSHRLPATRADMLRRLGRPDEAAREYRRALDRVGTAPERAFLQQRLAEVSGPGAPPPEPGTSRTPRAATGQGPGCG